MSQLANKKSLDLAPLLTMRSKVLIRTSKTTIHKILIRPIVTYGSEYCLIKNEDAADLGAFERKILRRIFSVKKINEDN